MLVVLADAVDADHEDDVGPGYVFRLKPDAGGVVGVEAGGQGVLEDLEGSVGIGDSFGPDPLLQVFDYAQRRLDADIGGDEDLFQFVPKPVVEIGGAEDVENAAEPAVAAAADALVHLFPVFGAVALEDAEHKVGL